MASKEIDCELTTATVQALVGPRFHDVHYLNEGWDSWVYAARDHAGADWILRFPKRAEVARLLAREVALLPRLGPRLPLPVPEFTLFGEPGAGYPHRFTGYRRLAGYMGIERLDAAVDVAALGAALGGFLAALHRFPVAEARALGVGDDDDGGGRAKRMAEGARLLVEHGGVLDAVVARRAAGLLASPPAGSDDRVLIHADLWPEHLVMQDGRLTGVIDWGDVAIGDPALDLAGLYAWHGAPLLAAGLTHYGRDRGLDGAALAELATRARYNAALRAVHDLEFAARAERPEYAALGRHALGHLADDADLDG